MTRVFKGREQYPSRDLVHPIETSVKEPLPEFEIDDRQAGSGGTNSATITITGKGPASNLTTTLQAAVKVTATGPPACP
jgi:hypothetical protein